jgi:hypothetical protein
MATYRITAPDGTIYNVNGEGTGEEAIKFLQQQLAQPQQAQPVEQQKQEAPSGFLRGLRDPVDALAQMIDRALPSGVSSQINEINNWLADRSPLVEKLGPGGQQQYLTERERAYQAQRQAAGETGFDWGRLGGNVLSPMNLAVASRLPAAASALGRLGVGAGGGALMGSLAQPLPDTPNFWTEKAKQAGTGAALGGALSGIGQGLGYLGRQARRPEVAQLRAAGVEPTMGETAGGWVSRMEEKASSLPVVGDAIRAARERARTQFNTATINRALQPLGAQVRSSGNEGIAEAQKIVSRAYDDAINLLPEVQLDATATARVGQLWGSLRSQGDAVREGFDRFLVHEVQPRFNAGTIPTAQFKALDSDLGSRIRESEGALRTAFQGLQRILRETAGRNSPAYRAAQARADAAHARLVRVEAAANAAKLAMGQTQGGQAQAGLFTPGQLAAAAKAADTSSRKRANAAGNALMQKWAQTGQEVLGNVVGNSYTFDRSAVAALLAAPFYPGPAAALAAGPLLYTAPAQRAITGLMRNLPEFTGTTGAAYGGLFGGMR